MSAGGVTTWYDFAAAILDEASKSPPDLSWRSAATGGRALIAKRISPITTAQYPTLARGPAHSVLSNDRFVERFGIQLTDWRTQLHSAFTDS